MAGGTVRDIRAPYPKGANAWHLITFGPLDIPDSEETSDVLFDSFVAPFKFRAMECRITALDITGAGISINIEDDDSNVLVADAGIAVIVQGNGSSEKLAVVKSVVINAGAIVSASFQCAGSETTKSLKVRLWVEPVN